MAIIKKFNKALDNIGNAGGIKGVDSSEIEEQSYILQLDKNDVSLIYRSLNHLWHSELCEFLSAFQACFGYAAEVIAYSTNVGVRT